MSGKQQDKMQKRILLGHLNSFGDCLYATTVARQIKKDYPGCHLTWAIGSMCRSVLDGNPHVDEIWEVPLRTIEEANTTWRKFEREALKRKERGDFDEVFFTQFNPSRLYYYDGMIRASTFRGYPKPITVSVSPVLRLFPDEVENVRRFVQRHNLADRKHVILFECAPKSGQSFVTPEFSLAVSQKLVDSIPDMSIILSSNMKLLSNNERIIDGSSLSFRENAELTKYCTLLVGCSSGITWISTSDWAKPLPMIQLIKPDAFYFASVVQDFEYWGLATDNIIEMSTCFVDKLVQCIETVVNNGFEIARDNFHERIPVSFNAYATFMCGFLRSGKIVSAMKLFLNNFRRYGLHSGLFLSFFSKKSLSREHNCNA